jgi:hypothetical protein
MLIRFNGAEFAIIEAEAIVRDRAVERVGLGIDLRRGKATRFERQLVGVCGEAAVQKALGGDVGMVRSGGNLDGGIDVEIMGFTIQVKASVHEAPRWVYANRKGRIRADIVVQTAAGMSLWSHRICGWRVTKEYDQLRESVEIYGEPTKAMSVRHLHPFEDFIALIKGLTRGERAITR